MSVSNWIVEGWGKIKSEKKNKMQKNEGHERDKEKGGERIYLQHPGHFTVQDQPICQRTGRVFKEVEDCLRQDAIAWTEAANRINIIASFLIN